MKKMLFASVMVCLLEFACTCRGESGVESKVIHAGNIPVSIRPGLLGDSGVAAGDLATVNDLATKLSISNITPTVTSETNTVPSNKAVDDALALKVDNNNGTATNLSVSGGLTVSAVYSNASTTISGTNAGTYAGVYVYHHTDPTYSDVFTNSAGLFLFSNVDQYYAGTYALGASVGSSTYCGNDSVWVDGGTGAPADVIQTGTPAHNLIDSGNLTMNGVNPSISLPLYTGGGAWLVSGGNNIGTGSMGLVLNSPFAFVLNSDFTANKGWNGFALAIGQTNYCSFSTTFGGWGESLGLPDQPNFFMYNDYSYYNSLGGDIAYIIGLVSQVYKINYRLMLNPDVIPTSRTNALIGEIYVDGTNEVLKIRLD